MQLTRNEKIAMREEERQRSYRWVEGLSAGGR